MKLYKKIDIFWCDEYICSTNQSKTCKEAKRRYVESLETRSHQLGGLGLLETRILKTPEQIKAKFAK